MRIHPSPLFLHCFCQNSVVYAVCLVFSFWGRQFNANQSLGLSFADMNGKQAVNSSSFLWPQCHLLSTAVRAVCMAVLKCTPGNVSLVKNTLAARLGQVKSPPSSDPTVSDDSRMLRAGKQKYRQSF